MWGARFGCAQFKDRNPSRFSSVPDTAKVLSDIVKSTNRLVYEHRVGRRELLIPIPWT